jgi:hypothetical protein
MEAPVLNAEELSLRFQRYLEETRRAFDHPMHETSQAKLQEARRKLANWMAARGVMLDFVTPAKERTDV